MAVTAELALRFLAENLVFLIPAYLIYEWFRDTEISFLVFSSVLTGLAVSYIMGLLYFHPVPGGTENAFPSQHTTVLFAAIWPVYYYRSREMATVFLISGLLTGVARVMIDKHYPVDLLGALTASMIGFAIIYYLEDEIRSVASLLSDIQNRIFGRSS